MTAPTHNLTAHRDTAYGFVYWSCDICPGVFGGQDAHDEAVDDAEWSSGHLCDKPDRLRFCNRWPCIDAPVDSRSRLRRWLDRITTASEGMS